jgi:hypothetical protein
MRLFVMKITYDIPPERGWPKGQNRELQLQRIVFFTAGYPSLRFRSLMGGCPTKRSGWNLGFRV